MKKYFFTDYQKTVSANTSEEALSLVRVDSKNAPASVQGEQSDSVLNTSKKKAKGNSSKK